MHRFISMWKQQKTIDRLEDRLRSCEQKCDDLERAKKSLDLEFTELYDKVSHQMSRMAKRYAREQKDPPLENGPDPDSSTSSNLDPISQSIMLRRAGVLRAEK